jgi:hypothetical protein
MIAWALVIPCAGLAVRTSSATAAAGAVFSGSATGTVITVSGNSFTIQTAGRRIGVVNAMTAAANRITSHDYPYVYGGGHAEAGTASVGIRGLGYNGRRRGFDCSGSIAAVLAAAGLWPAGGGVPSDAGVISTLRSERLIQRGVGKGPVDVTLYDHRGVHIFMNIDGRFFGTSDGAGGGNPHGGAGWLDDGAPDASSLGYKAYHFPRSVLRGSTSSGHILSFQLGALQTGAAGLAVGEEAQVSYEETASGELLASSVGFPGGATTSGTVASIAPDGSSFTIQTTAGGSITFSTADDPELVQSLVIGDSAQVTYTTSSGGPVALTVTDTGSPAGSTVSGDGSTGVGSGSAPGPFPAG